MTTPPTEAATEDELTGHALRGHLEKLYPSDVAGSVLGRLWEIIGRFRSTHPRLADDRRAGPFDETDVWLIAYGDQVRAPGQPPLETLRTFLEGRVAGAVRGLHLLPHYPYTSDDGFAVVDYTLVDPLLGDWSHVEELGQSFRLMLDAVVNHTSASSPWFRSWLADEGCHDFYHRLEPGSDIGSVTRPRTSPLLSPFDSADGLRHVWTTFSPDQVDLNYENPEVLLTVTEILLSYVGRGASALRLDAIAFLWKHLGTTCVHLPETHEVIKLWRTVMEAVDTGTLLVTETNVPHRENISYFGDGTDEAHLVYQFPLPPLVLYAFHLADTSVLQEWMGTLSTPSPETAFLNFLGSHDGIGVRPVEGLLTPGEIRHLCDIVTEQGGGVTHRALPDGGQSPYELNTVYFDALNPVDTVEPLDVQVDRFMAAQSILLALAGVPALYFHALFGSRNWRDGVDLTGRLRVINRQKFSLEELEDELTDPASLRHQVFARMIARIEVRVREPAFHPAGPQRVVASQPVFLAFEREAVDGSSRVLCVHNVTGREQWFQAGRDDGLTVQGELLDLCDGSRHKVSREGTLDIALPPFGVRWLREVR